MYFDLRAKILFFSLCTYNYFPHLSFCIAPWSQAGADYTQACISSKYTEISDKGTVVEDTYNPKCFSFYN